MGSTIFAISSIPSSEPVANTDRPTAQPHHDVNRVAIYPGTFDPVHNGHVDVIQRATRLFDTVLVAVASSQGKQPMFAVEDRVALVETATAHLKGVRTLAFDGLLVDLLTREKARVIVRGLRAISDFEYEMQMALANRQMQPDLETIFLMPSQEHIFLSSNIVREVARLGGDSSQFVPDNVEKALRVRFRGA